MGNFGLGKLCRDSRTEHPSFCSRLVLLARICLGQCGLNRSHSSHQLMDIWKEFSWRVHWEVQKK